MDHRTNENCQVSEQKVMFDRSWKLKLLSAHSEFLIWLSVYVAEQDMRLLKKLKGTRFFLGRFEI